MGEISVALLEEYTKLGTPEDFKKVLDLVNAVQSLLKSESSLPIHWTCHSYQRLQGHRSI